MCKSELTKVVEFLNFVYKVSSIEFDKKYNTKIVVVVMYCFYLYFLKFTLWSYNKHMSDVWQLKREGPLSGFLEETSNPEQEQWTI